jgi:hypothetical protein
MSDIFRACSPRLARRRALSNCDPRNRKSARYPQAAAWLSASPTWRPRPSSRKILAKLHRQVAVLEPHRHSPGQQERHLGPGHACSAARAGNSRTHPRSGCEGRPRSRQPTEPCASQNLATRLRLVLIGELLLLSCASTRRRACRPSLVTERWPKPLHRTVIRMGLRLRRGYLRIGAPWALRLIRTVDLDRATSIDQPDDAAMFQLRS